MYLPLVYVWILMVFTFVHIVLSTFKVNWTLFLTCKLMIKIWWWRSWGFILWLTPINSHIWTIYSWSIGWHLFMGAKNGYASFHWAMEVKPVFSSENRKQFFIHFNIWTNEWARASKFIIKRYALFLMCKDLLSVVTNISPWP